MNLATGCKANHGLSDETFPCDWQKDNIQYFKNSLLGCEQRMFMNEFITLPEQPDISQIGRPSQLLSGEQSLQRPIRGVGGEGDGGGRGLLGDQNRKLQAC